jgi:hypothetical protein
MVNYPGCHQLPAHFALHDDLVRTHSNGGVLIATFTNRKAAEFALNWARQLQQVGLKSLIGVSERLTHWGAAGDVGGGEEAFRLAGAGLFCADGPMMQINGQAGRWAEVSALLLSGLDILISDSDIAWLRDPLPYFVAAKRAHPALDFLLATDRAFNSYSSTPLSVQPSGRPGRAGERGQRGEGRGRGSGRTREPGPHRRRLSERGDWAPGVQRWAAAGGDAGMARGVRCNAMAWAEASDVGGQMWREKSGPGEVGTPAVRASAVAAWGWSRAADTRGAAQPQATDGADGEVSSERYVGAHQGQDGAGASISPWPGHLRESMGFQAPWRPAVAEPMTGRASTSVRHVTTARDALWDASMRPVDASSELQTESDTSTDASTGRVHSGRRLGRVAGGGAGGEAAAAAVPRSAGRKGPSGAAGQGGRGGGNFDITQGRWTLAQWLGKRGNQDGERAGARGEDDGDKARERLAKLRARQEVQRSSEEEEMMLVGEMVEQVG